MYFRIAISVLAILAATEAAPSKQNHWALLVAGSNGYYNYRHQADIAHAYQIMKRFGVPDSNIVTMMYDDVANSKENPFPGTLINRPNGPDVYHGVVKDYVKDDVTPENFLRILAGDAEGMKGIGSGKVIASGPDDHVFVNFADHGAPGILAFPRTFLHVAQLNKTIWEMYRQKKFHKMVMYIEACEAGSMFDQTLPSDINILSVTATNSTTSSYACYFDEKRHTYLGDLFSVKWMEDSDMGLGSTETLMDQFHTVKAEVNLSTVCMFGDREIASHYMVAEFQGDDTVMRPPTAKIEKPRTPIFDAVPSPDVPLHIAKETYKRATTKEEKEAALKEFAKLTYMRQMVDEIVDKIVDAAVGKTNVLKEIVLQEKMPLKSAHACYQSAVDAFHAKCFNLGQNGYALRKLQMLVNLCEMGVKAGNVVNAVNMACNGGPWDGAQ